MTHPSVEPTQAFDLDYSIHDCPFDRRLDTQFLNRRIDEVMVRESKARGGRALDVACGLGKLAVNLREHGTESWGLDPSHEMLGLSRWVYPPEQLILVRGIAESLPFRDGTFDCIVCQGSLDHFVEPQAFMREAARVLCPGGRLVIALSNYESLSCRLGRLLYRLAIDLLRRPQPPHRPYWQPPPDHYHKGDVSFVRQLGGDRLRLARCYGISLLWLLYYWDSTLGSLPRPLADAILVALDRIAHRAPGLADMIISIWRPRAVGEDAR